MEQENQNILYTIFFK